jgi:hypothetical protein
MTEAEWMACTEPEPMLVFLRGKSSERKLRFFARACLCREWHLLSIVSQNLVKVTEQFDDRLITEERLTVSVRLHRDWMHRLNDHYSAQFICAKIVNQLVWGAAWAVAWNAVSEIRRAIRADSSPEDVCKETTGQAILTREVFGNPFRPVSLDPSWLTWRDGTIPRLAQVIYEARELPNGYLDRDRLAVLGDALEDAGCDDQGILDHCRGPGPHVRGCWVVDLILGKD